MNISKFSAILVFFISTGVSAEVVFFGGMRKSCHISMESLAASIKEDNNPEKSYKSYLFDVGHCGAIEIHYAKDSTKAAISSVLREDKNYHKNLIRINDDEQIQTLLKNSVDKCDSAELASAICTLQQERLLQEKSLLKRQKQIEKIENFMKNKNR